MISSLQRRSSRAKPLAFSPFPENKHVNIKNTAENEGGERAIDRDETESDRETDSQRERARQTRKDRGRQRDTETSKQTRKDRGRQRDTETEIYKTEKALFRTVYRHFPSSMFVPVAERTVVTRHPIDIQETLELR
jgi:hypothetical protein